MASYKDNNNKIHNDMDGEALNLPSWPKGLTKISDADANALRALPQQTPAEIEENKIKLVEAELGKANIRVLVDTILPMFQDGSIATATTDSILLAAKDKRKAEL